MEYKAIMDIIEKPISGEWGIEPSNGPVIKVLRNTNFRNDGSLNLKDVIEREISHSKTAQKKLIYGDILIEKSGGSPAQPVGRVVFFDQTEGEYLFSNFTSPIRPREGIFSKYLFYLLYGNHLFKKTLSYQNKTTGILNLQLERYLKESKIPVPIVTQQERIANILDHADLVRRKNRMILEKYNELTHSVFYDMFGDPYGNPRQWPVIKIMGVASPKKNSIKAGPFGSSLKKEYYVSSGYKIYGQEQVIRDDFTYGNYYINNKLYSKLESCKVSEGDILISLVGSYGLISIVPKVFEPGIINPRLMKISLNHEVVNPFFFKFLLQSKGIRAKIKNSTHGGTMEIINVGIMKNIEVPIPPLPLQEKFAGILEDINNQKDLTKRSIEKSEDLFQSLLQRAFKGEL